VLEKTQPGEERKQELFYQSLSDQILHTWDEWQASNGVKLTNLLSDYRLPED
jgi:hypothetical protein